MKKELIIKAYAKQLNIVLNTIKPLFLEDKSSMTQFDLNNDLTVADEGVLQRLFDTVLKGFELIAKKYELTEDIGKSLYVYIEKLQKNYHFHMKDNQDIDENKILEGLKPLARLVGDIHQVGEIIKITTTLNNFLDYNFSDGHEFMQKLVVHMLPEQYHKKLADVIKQNNNFTIMRQSLINELSCWQESNIKDSITSLVMFAAIAQYCLKKLEKEDTTLNIYARVGNNKINLPINEMLTKQLDSIVQQISDKQLAEKMGKKGSDSVNIDDLVNYINVDKDKSTKSQPKKSVQGKKKPKKVSKNNVEGNSGDVKRISALQEVENNKADESKSIIGKLLDTSKSKTFVSVKMQTEVLENKGQLQFEPFMLEAFTLSTNKPDLVMQSAISLELKSKIKQSHNQSTQADTLPDCLPKLPYSAFDVIDNQSDFQKKSYQAKSYRSHTDQLPYLRDQTIKKAVGEIQTIFLSAMKNQNYLPKVFFSPEFLNFTGSCLVNQKFGELIDAFEKEAALSPNQAPKEVCGQVAKVFCEYKMYSFIDKETQHQSTRINTKENAI
ncbi:hypothetical protein [Facilibium subflavum]|uniref:hypothetical protein n=1 Tax=Facilibium subflavum TaxID=2219058 RepID=UPI000E653929|nr:hypothetical protein [Facilibium subflavum]